MEQLKKSAIEEALTQQYILLKKYKDNLYILECSAASYSPNQVPLEITNQMNDTKEKIESIEKDIAILTELLSVVESSNPEEDNISKEKASNGSPQQEKKNKSGWVFICGLLTAIAVACSGFSGSMSNTIDKQFVGNPSRFPDFSIPYICPSMGTTNKKASSSNTNEVVIYSDVDIVTKIYTYPQGEELISSPITAGSCRQANLISGTYILYTIPKINTSPYGYEFDIFTKQKVIITINKGKIDIKVF